MVSQRIPDDRLSGRPGVGAAGLEVPYRDALEMARGLAVPGRRRILGIVGKPGGGKSALAARLVEDLAGLAIYGAYVRYVIAKGRG